jgi:predicted transcriptional regulator
MSERSERRDKMEIIVDILTAIQNKPHGIKPTHLLYKANLSYQRLNEYLNDLMLKNLIMQEMNKKTTLYKVTDQGYKFLAEYKKMKEFVNSFGL